MQGYPYQAPPQVYYPSPQQPQQQQQYGGGFGVTITTTYPPQGFPQGYPQQGYPQQGFQQGYPPQQPVYTSPPPQVVHYSSAPCTVSVPSGDCFIQSEHCGLVLDVSGSSRDDRAALILYNRHGDPNQKFKFYNNMIYTHCGKVLDVEGGVKHGGKVIQYTPHGGQNQKWDLYPDGTIRAAGTNLCLDIEGGSRSERAQLVVMPYQYGSTSQRWRIKGDGEQRWKVRSQGWDCTNVTVVYPKHTRGQHCRLHEQPRLRHCGGNRHQEVHHHPHQSSNSSSSVRHPPMGSVFITSKLNGLALDIQGASRDDRAALHMYRKHGGDNQKFRFENGMIYCVHSGKVLDVEGGSLQDNAKVVQYTPHGGQNQKWELHSDDTIRVAGTNYCLDIQGGSTAEGTRLIIYTHHGKANQQWNISQW